jgi:hypothetical protein
MYINFLCALFKGISVLTHYKHLSPDMRTETNYLKTAKSCKDHLTVAISAVTIHINASELAPKLQFLFFDC